MSNRVTYEAISVLGGSGYMKDYPLEQLYRDARITSIYEGTSQLQVLAAIRGVTSGTAEKRFVELAAAAPPAGLEAEAESLKAVREKLVAAIEFVKKGQSADYLDLYARSLVDVSTDVYLSYLWLEMARHSAAKAVSARRFIGRAALRCEHLLKLVTSGDRSTLDAFDVLVGPKFGDA